MWRACVRACVRACGVKCVSCKIKSRLKPVHHPATPFIPGPHPRPRRRRRGGNSAHPSTSTPSPAAATAAAAGSAGAPRREEVRQPRVPLRRQPPRRARDDRRVPRWRGQPPNDERVEGLAAARVAPQGALEGPRGAAGVSSGGAGPGAQEPSVREEGRGGRRRGRGKGREACCCCCCVRSGGPRGAVRARVSQPRTTASSEPSPRSIAAMMVRVRWVGWVVARSPSARRAEGKLSAAMFNSARTSLVSSWPAWTEVIAVNRFRRASGSSSGSISAKAAARSGCGCASQAFFNTRAAFFLSPPRM